MEIVDILDSDELYRKISPAHLKNGEVHYLAYRLPNNADNCMSVDLAKLTTTEACLQRDQKPGRGIGGIIARVPRGLLFEVFHDPEEDNYAHSSIQGDYQKKQLCAELARATRIVVEPPAGATAP